MPNHNWATSYIGVPFQTHGRSLAGLDCWGLCVCVYREAFDIDLPSYDTGYVGAGRSDAADLSVLIEAGRVEWREVHAGDELPGDLILLRLWNRPIHIGVVVGGHRMLHACEGINVAMERYDGAMWRRKVVGFYRHPLITVRTDT